MKITGNFNVNGQPFASWFNKNLAGKKVFPHRVDASNFAKVMQYLENLTGKSEISLGEFCGHFAIIYNETGGTFKVLREYGKVSYMFNRLKLKGGGTKRSYNIAPNLLAGNQLKEWGVIRDPADVKLWNGQQYPINAPKEVQKAALKCDFYRFRGYGFNQLTWRTNYKNCLQPHLPKNIDDYSVEEFENAIMNLDIATKTFHSFITQSSIARKAVEELSKNNFTPYGNLVSGGWKSYVKNKFVPRCEGVYQHLNQCEISNHLSLV